MAVVLSTGAKILLLEQGLKPGFAECAVLLFSGNPPLNPDNGIPAGSSLIAKAAVDPDSWAAGSGTGFGITWQDADAEGIMAAVMTSPIIAKGVADGVVRFGWIVPDVVGSEATGSSSTIARIQGIAAVGSGEIKLSNSSFAVGSQSTIDTMQMRF